MAYIEGTAALNGRTDLHAEVTGRIVYINEAHRYYRVIYQMPGCTGTAHECFKY